MFSIFRHTFRQWARNGANSEPARRPALRPHRDCLEDRLLLSLAGAETFVNAIRPVVQPEARTPPSNNDVPVVVRVEVKNSEDLSG